MHTLGKILSNGMEPNVDHLEVVMLIPLAYLKAITPTVIPSFFERIGITAFHKLVARTSFSNVNIGST